jgi:NADP-dependent 3-hydroxy acid dehydrogenase YdfG
MSIVQRTNPLNLQYRICIVTGAVSPLGTIICKTLLKADAFVFAVDMKMKDDS